MTRRRRAALGAALLLALGAAGLWAYERRHPPDVRGSATVEFVPGDVPAPRPLPAGEAGVAWPTYGFDVRRLRYAPGIDLRPPFRRTWTFRGGALLEFPPSIAHGRLYLPTFDGRFYALDAETGKPVWRYGSGRCAWASPAVAGRTVYQTFLNRSGSCDARSNALGGELDAFDAASGRLRWRVRLGPTESSPLVAAGLVFVGDWDGLVHAVDARTGRRRWAFRTGGPVKGSLVLAGGRVVVGSYDGRVYALDARTGRLAWRAAGQARLGGAGRFYSTPAAAYGRVYLGSTDGKVYSFGALSGKLR